MHQNIANKNFKQLYFTLASSNYYECIDGVTKSTDPSCSEFVVHVEIDYDYRFITNLETRDDILYVLKHCFYKMHKKNLPIYGVDFVGLKDFTTSKKDAQKHISKKPPRNYLMKSENLYADPKKSTHRKKSSNTADTSNNGSDEANLGPHRKMSVRPPMLMGEPEDNLTGPVEGMPDRRQPKGTIYSKDKGKEVCLEDFDIKKVIGKGSFGKVYLASKISDGKIYAMKSIRKDVIVDNDQIESAKMEKQILLHNKHPFLVKMSYIFQTEHKVFFVMNFVRGGELFTHLCDERRFTEEKTRFYALQIILAIGYLHKQGVVYRDLKPENILIQADGYLALTDFGLAKSIQK